MYQVVDRDLAAIGEIKVLFQGRYKECEEYLREACKRNEPVDLIDSKGRFATWFVWF